MSVAATTAANLVIMSDIAMRKVIRDFEQAGAIDLQNAMAPPPGTSRSTLTRLVRHQILVRTGDGLFYLDQAARAQVARDQGKAGLAGIVGLVGILVLVAICLAVFG